MESPKNSVKRKATSTIWASFVKLEDEDGEHGKRAQCIICHKILSCKSLKKHLIGKHKDYVSERQELTNGLTEETDTSFKIETKKKKKKRNSQESKKGDEKDIMEDKTAQNDTQKNEVKNIKLNSSFKTEPEDQPIKLNTALLAVQRILDQLPKNIQYKAEVDMLDLVYSLHAKYCE